MKHIPLALYIIFYPILYLQIDEAPKFIRRNTKMAGKFGAMRRQDIPEYPVDGIRGILINALVIY